MAVLIRDLLKLVEHIAPPHLAYSWDRIGLQVSSGHRDITKVIVCLDLTLDIMKEAIDTGAEAIISHHPLIWEPISALTPSTPHGSLIMALVKYEIGFIAAHTNWDCAPGGVSDALLIQLGLAPELPRRQRGELRQDYKMVTFAPAEAVDAIIDLCSEHGAGAIGSYTRCAFTSIGEGRFDAPTHAKPAIGQPGERNIVHETRIEMRVPEHALGRVRAALLHSHPYEAPPYDFIQLQPEPALDSIRTAALEPSMSLKEITELVETRLETKCLVWPGHGDFSRTYDRIACAGGAAGKMWFDAQRSLSSVFVTGEIAHDQVIAATNQGMSVIQAGHYATEAPGMKEMARRLNEAGGEVEFFFAEPCQGTGGRPLACDYVPPILD